MRQGVPKPRFAQEVLLDKPLPVSPTAAVAAPTQPRIQLWPLLGLVFAIGAVIFLLAFRSDGRVHTLGSKFTGIVLEALPFVMLGSLIGGFIEVFVSRDRLTALLPKRTLPAIFAAGLLGIVLPVCECAVIVVTRRLVRKGVPFSVAVAYLLAGPIVNPIVAASTAVAYTGDMTVVATRLIAGFAIAVAIALIVDTFFPGQRALLPGIAETGPHHDHGHTHSHSNDPCCAADTVAGAEPGAAPTVATHATPRPKPPLFGRLVHSVEHAADDFLHISQFLIVGAFAAAICQTYLIERQFFVDLANTPAAAIGVMMLLAILLNLCSEADAFVAATFRFTLPLSAQMAFMVLGPMLDLKLVAMYLSFVRRPALILMITLMLAFVFAMMLALDALAWSQP